MKKGIRDVTERDRKGFGKKAGKRIGIGSVCGLSGLALMLMLSLGGCEAAELLNEVPRTASVEIDEGVVEESESGGQTVRETEGAETGETDSKEPEKNSGESFLKSWTGSYAYDSLGEAEQIWYNDIAESLGQMGELVRLDRQGLEAGLDETHIDKIFQCIMMDHPELFYVEGYTYTKYVRGDRIVTIHFSGTYSMDKKQALARQAGIDAAVQPLLDGAQELSSDYDKVKYVYETIIRNTEYDLSAADNQNLYSVFVNHRSVCQGYAKAVQYLLNQLGVECTLVQGTVDTGEGHAWNLVKADGSYYYVDATWGDASYQPENGDLTGQYVPEINYDYLCVTTEQLLRTHILDSYVPMPVCDDMKDNYYVREGALFTSYDREQMKTLFEKNFAEGRYDVTVKCSDIDCFRQILKIMTEEQEVFHYIHNNEDSVIYTHNEKQLSMTFWVTNE